MAPQGTAAVQLQHPLHVTAGPLAAPAPPTYAPPLQPGVVFSALTAMCDCLHNACWPPGSHRART
eukprot:12901213-Prorocentrum_lima.AAC.1